MTISLANYLSIFEPLLGWECAYICHDLTTKKKDLR